MSYQEYLAQIKTKFINVKQANISRRDTLVTYDEIFKWEWIATKLKIFSFVAYADKVDEALIMKYMEDCLQYARKNKKGLPLGFQNGMVSYCILVSEDVDHAAIDYVIKRPKKHWCIFEMPIIVDLSKRKLYYYEGNIIWGAIYDFFLNKYILQNFSLQ